MRDGMGQIAETFGIFGATVASGRVAVTKVYRLCVCTIIESERNRKRSRARGWRERITGFIEGEGCFTYSRNGDSYNLYFAVKLTAVDYQILVDLQSYFRGGKIYNVKAAPPRQYSGKTKEARLFRITRASELLEVIRHFDEFPLRGSKAQSYRVWRKMVLEKSAFRKASKDRMKTLADELSQQSPRNQNWHP